MLSQTSELAIRTLLLLALKSDDRPSSPREMAEDLNCSRSYLAKTTGLLARAGLLRSVRGVNGGVLLARSPDRISLLQVVEACQGLVTADYCGEEPNSDRACSYHKAMAQLYRGIVNTLSSWTLQDLLGRPANPPEEGQEHVCRMYFSALAELEKE